MRPDALLMICSGLGRWQPVPGQEFVDPVDRVIGDAADYVAQIGFRIETVQPCGLDDGVHGCGTVAAGVGAGEEPVFAVMERYA